MSGYFCISLESLYRFAKNILFATPIERQKRPRQYYWKMFYILFIIFLSLVNIYRFAKKLFFIVFKIFISYVIFFRYAKKYLVAHKSHKSVTPKILNFISLVNFSRFAKNTFCHSHILDNCLDISSYFYQSCLVYRFA